LNSFLAHFFRRRTSEIRAGNPSEGTVHPLTSHSHLAPSGWACRVEHVPGPTNNSSTPMSPLIDGPREHASSPTGGVVSRIRGWASPSDPRPSSVASTDSPTKGTHPHSAAVSLATEEPAAPPFADGAPRPSPPPVELPSGLPRTPNGATPPTGAQLISQPPEPR
jgi:hypothetical protein